MTGQRLTSKNDEAEQKGKEARAWIEKVLKIEIQGDFGLALRDGVILCQVIQAFKPELITKIFDNKFKELQGVENMYEIID